MTPPPNRTAGASSGRQQPTSATTRKKKKKRNNPTNTSKKKSASPRPARKKKTPSKGNPRAGRPARPAGRISVRASGRAQVRFDRPFRYKDAVYDGGRAAADAVGLALHGDRVSFRPTRVRDGLLEGVIESVIERSRTELAGVYRMHGRAAVVDFADGKREREIRVPRARGAREGDWVVAEVVSHAEAPAPLEGRVIEVIGSREAPGGDITFFLRRHGCPEVFPAAALTQASKVAKRIGPAEIKRRRDLRSVPTFTIDGADSKDLDDAISIEKLGALGWRLGVHIADVSHYVREGTPLDLEAERRSTSVYPLDRVVPMLPEALSNGVCSLLPEVDRLAMSCFLDVSDEGIVKGVDICESVIRSDRRFTYEGVQSIFHRVDEGRELHPDDRSLAPRLLEARDAARVIRGERRRRGALDLDFPEPGLRCNRDGSAVTVMSRVRFESHRLIEDLMLVCNEAVARFAQKRGIPVPYRVHPGPEADESRRLVPILEDLGLEAPKGSRWRPQDLARVLDRASLLESGSIIQRRILRVLGRARYDVDPRAGHFGLASGAYLHFTSPIRRYPDLLVHRGLRAFLAGESDDTGLPALAAVAATCSERERAAASVEWDVAGRRLLGLASRFTGEKFDGRVTAITSIGAFVEPEGLGVEGLLPLRTLPGAWRHDGVTEVLRQSGRGGRRLAIGDPVIVKLEKADPDRLRLDLSWAEPRRRSNSRRKRT